MKEEIKKMQLDIKVKTETIIQLKEEKDKCDKAYRTKCDEYDS